MIGIEFNFSDLASKKRYEILQNRFYWNDINIFDLGLKTSKLILNFDITVEERNNGNVTYLDVNFENDFLLPNILKLAEKNYYLFLNEIYQLYTKDLKEGFTNQFIENLREEKISINECDYLNSNVKNEIVLQIEILENKVSSYLSNPYPFIKEKVEFNLRQTDVVFLFHLLREKKVINHITDADLGRIIDSSCKSFNSNDSKTYLDVKNSRKLINNFKNVSRSDSEPLKRLKEIFSKTDFFNI
jgi:hypothetical protein